MLHAHPHLDRALTRRAWRLVLAAVAVSALVAAFQIPPQSAVATETPPEPGTGAPADPPATRASQPNVLLISTDDQTVADLEYMPWTRRLLGDQGVTFTDAVSSYPLCCPARATIVTGMLSHNHGVRTNKPPFGGYPALKNNKDGLNEHTIGTWLQESAGKYLTMFTGKYLNGYHGVDLADVPPGWDSWHATTRSVYNYHRFTVLNRDFRTPDVAQSQTYGPDSYQTDQFGTFTREHIEAAHDENRPFFIWESNLAPHDACSPRPGGGQCKWGPAVPADQDARKFSRLGLPATKDPSFNERVVSEKPAYVRGLAPWGQRRFDAAVRKNRMRVRSLQAVDRSVKQTVEKLEELGELGNTLIIFTSDNGYQLGEHRWMGKILPYEQSLQVPLLMRWDDGDLRVGAKISKTVALADIAATIADAADVPMDEATRTLHLKGYDHVLDGRSLLPMARGQAASPGYGAMSIESGQEGWATSDHRWFYRGVRTRRYTFLHYPRTNENELYDRRKDPSELTNVAYRPAYRPVVAALSSKLAALKDCAGEECLDVGGAVPAPRPEPWLARDLTVHPDDLGSIGNAGQVVTLTAANWRTGRGMATAWQRRGRTWTVRRGPFPVRLGAQGLDPAAHRRDGTGKTPAGTFAPAFALGRLRDPGTTLPYTRFDRNDYWVMDRRDPRTYNVYQDRRSAEAAWRPFAAENWWSNRARYPYALMLDYNLPQRVRFARTARQYQSTRPADVRRGSFALHTGARVADHGWTSMSRTQLRWLLRWMRPARQHTVFVVGTPGYLRGHL